jgi:hypothetical protein
VSGYASIRRNAMSVLRKGEATYATDATPVAATDAVWLLKPGSTPNIMPDTYGFDGDNGPNSAGLQPRLHSAPSQRSGTIDIDWQHQGPGVAYSVSAFALNGGDGMMQSCGYAKTLVTTAGSETITYTPVGDGTTPVSDTIYGFDGQVLAAGNMRKKVLLGALGSLKVAAPGLAVPTFTGSYKGIFSGPTEGAFTAPTLATTTIAPNMAGAIFTIDGTALPLWSWSFEAARDLSTDRTPVTAAGGYTGVVAGGWMPKLTVTFEDQLLATYSGWTKRASAATVAVVLTFGTVQYNKRTLNVATGQISKITDSGKGSVGLTTLEISCIPSTPAGNDSHTWVDS